MTEEQDKQTVSPSAVLPVDARQVLADQLVEQAKTDGISLIGPGGLLSDITKRVLETGLEVELTDHLGYEKHAAEGRNGGTPATAPFQALITDVGPVTLDVPRDRDGTFDPALVRKRQRRLNGVDGLVISLCSKGLTTGEISAHLAEVYARRCPRRRSRKSPTPWSLFGGERPCVADRQTTARANGLADLSYFLGGSLPSDERRRHERAPRDRVPPAASGPAGGTVLG